jgi:hypothetical protein
LPPPSRWRISDPCSFTIYTDHHHDRTAHTLRQDLGRPPGRQQEDGTCLLYIDRHLVHEVTSPQAFEGLRMAGRKVRAPEKTLAVVDHNVPTTPTGRTASKNEESRIQVEALAKNAADFGVEYFPRTTSARASSTSSGRNRASPCPA